LHIFLTRSYLINKSDLIDAISLKENLTDKNASEIVNLIFDGFTDALKNGGRIEIRGFGSFSVRKYGGYT
jgi:integration host factor subunit beta